jgi:hypothetical protein
MGQNRGCEIATLEGSNSQRCRRSRQRHINNLSKNDNLCLTQIDMKHIDKQ